MYLVKLQQEDVGYISNEKNFKEIINKEILESDEKNVEFISMNVEPQYEMKLVSRNQESSEQAILSQLKDNTTITYKFYEIALNGSEKTYVNTLEDAINVVDKIKQEYKDAKDLQIVEKYTENKEEVATSSVEVAQSDLKNIINTKVEKEESKQQKTIADISGIKISSIPVKGQITSRYGEGSRRRRSSHTGLDIGAKSGTGIHVVADGIVTFAGTKGSYGKLVKVNHGKGVETWYAHCSKIYTTQGAKVQSGDIISVVGSTGNSTGPHLHLEIRLNGNTINPQKYLYK